VGKLTRELSALACAALLVLPGVAQPQPGLNPIIALTLQIVLVLGFIFVVLLLTKKISALIDRIREKRKK